MKHYKITWTGIGLAGTLIAALLPPSEWRAILMIIFTGFGPAALLPGRYNLVGLSLTSLCLALPLWGLLSLACWAVHLPWLLPFSPAIINGICLAVQICIRPRKKFRPLTIGDACALAVMAVMAIPTLLIQQVNGPHDTPSGPAFLSRLYIAHDYFYFSALAQAAKDQQGYPAANPFMAGAPNAYPSLLQCGAGGLASLSEDIAVLALWPIYAWLLLPAIGLNYLALRRWLPRRNRKADLLLAFGFLLFLAIRPDHFIYLQTQGAAFALLALALLVMPRSSARGQHYRWICFGFILVLMIFSHTVTALAGMALLAGVMLRLIGRRRLKVALPTRLLRAAVVVVTTGLFLWTISRTGKADGVDEFSQSFLWLMMRNNVFPYVPALIVTAWLCRRNGAGHPLAIAGLLLITCSMAYWLIGLSARSEDGVFFAVFNAARFGLYGLMFSLVFVPVKGRPAVIALGALCFALVLYPAQVVKTLPDFVTEPPKVFPVSQWRMLRKAMPVQPGHASSMITNVPAYSISTVSGYAQYDPHNRMFALGTQPSIEFEKRITNNIAFFDTMTPDQRLQFMQSRRLDAVVAISPIEAMAAVEALLPRDAVDITTGPAYSVFRMKPAAVRN